MAANLYSKTKMPFEVEWPLEKVWIINLAPIFFILFITVWIKFILEEKIGIYEKDWKCSITHVFFLYELVIICVDLQNYFFVLLLQSWKTTIIVIQNSILSLFLSTKTVNVVLPNLSVYFVTREKLNYYTLSKQNILFNVMFNKQI